MDELSAFIDRVYREPYSQLKNNCFHKSLRIKRKAEELGKQADLVACVSIVRIKKWHNLLTVNPHMYVLIDGKKIDVSLDPKKEEEYSKNSEKKLILPVNISKLRRSLSRLFARGTVREKHGY
ncbi:MAG: hypothetical protein HY665_04130 [Chloroflexi bacterium]|nr:hypothetical protein [Chloroflexota bacterium]